MHDGSSPQANRPAPPPPTVDGGVHGLLFRRTVPYLQRVPAGSWVFVVPLHPAGRESEDAAGQVPPRRRAGHFPEHSHGFRHHAGGVRRRHGHRLGDRRRPVVHLRLADHRGAGGHGRAREGLQGRVRDQRRQPFARHDAGRRGGPEGAAWALHHAGDRRRHGQRQAAGHRDRARLPHVPHVHGRQGGGLHDAAREAHRGAGRHLAQGSQRPHLGTQAELAARGGRRRPAPVHGVPQGLRLA